jgi:hypothetical protein
MICHIKLVHIGSAVMENEKYSNFSLHVAQFDTTNGKKLREPSFIGPRMEYLPRRVEETLVGILQNLVVYQPMIKRNAMWKLMAIK